MEKYLFEVKKSPAPLTDNSMIKKNLEYNDTFNDNIKTLARKIFNTAKQIRSYVKNNKFTNKEIMEVGDHIKSINDKKVTDATVL